MRTIEEIALEVAKKIGIVDSNFGEEFPLIEDFDKLAEFLRESLATLQREAGPVATYIGYGGAIGHVYRQEREVPRGARLFLHPQLPVEQAGTVPEGWKLVPIEPTQNMQDCYWNSSTCEDNWKAMLAASPLPPKGE